MRSVRRFIVAFLALLTALLASCGPLRAAQEFDGRCVGVRDGDTIDVLHDGRSVRVRVWGVDAPEQGQAFGSTAKRFASDFAFGKVVTVEVKDVDRYGRRVARVKLDGRDFGLELVRAGLAWWYEAHAPRATELAEAQREARSARRGLWADPNPVPPSSWRGAHPRR